MKEFVKYNIIRISLLICCVVWILGQTTVFAYQKINIDNLGLTFALSDDFIIYKNENFIENDFKSELNNENLCFFSVSKIKNMSIQIWNPVEVKYNTINDLTNSEIIKVMNDIDVLRVAKELLIENSIIKSIEIHNGQKYYTVKGYFKEESNVFCEYVITINNGHVIWCQIFNYDTYLWRNTNEILDSFDFTESKNFSSNIVNQTSKTKSMWNDALAKGVVESVFYFLVFSGLICVKRILRKFNCKSETSNEYINKKENVTDIYSHDLVYLEDVRESADIDNFCNCEREKCEICGKHVKKLTYCEIKDDYGKRYRNICDECILKYGSNVKEIILEDNTEDINIFNKQRFTIITYNKFLGKLRTEIKEVDVGKYPPEKFADKNVYYAIETEKSGEYLTEYYTKDNWEKQIEMNRLRDV